ncbi:MAG: methyltransferase [Methanomassiliicoccales archaeon]
MEDAMAHYGQWAAVALFALAYVIFIAFIPFYKKVENRPASVYVAFVVAFAFEMFGIPLSMYIVAWSIGYSLPEGILWGHTLVKVLGQLGTFIGFILGVIGGALVILGWKEIYAEYWGKKEGERGLVTKGVYRFIRHPQYTGFLLITMGMLIEWATIPLLVLWPILAYMYYKLAKKEEEWMEKEFGEAYRRYRSLTPMFIPIPFHKNE